MALLNGFDRLATSGVRVPPSLGSSAAKRRESMLRLLSDIPHAELWRSANMGVAATNAERYFSCKKDNNVH